jgi:hypothetical protein
MPGYLERVRLMVRRIRDRLTAHPDRRAAAPDSTTGVTRTDVTPSVHI